MAQEGLLSVRLLAADGESLYEVLEQAVLGRLEEKRLQRKTYVPQRYVDQIKNIAIELKERERPLEGQDQTRAVTTRLRP